MSAAIQLQSDKGSGALLLAQVDRVLHSSHFHGSELLRNLLIYLSKRAIDHPGEPVKEYNLAVDVLGRDATFDPRVDSAVRVHTARLRAKLAEYYVAEGADDPMVIEIPKGSYVLSWRCRDHDPATALQEHEPAIPLSTAVPPKWRRGTLITFAAGFVSALVVACGLWTLVRSADARQVPAPVRTFWSPFIESATPPIIAFSNHRFVGTSASGLRAFHEGVDSPADINETYSGTGTVMAVDELNTLFAAFHRSIRVKRAELLTWDDARTTNLILIGSPDANSRLTQLPPLQYFGFKSPCSPPDNCLPGILNLHSRPGEAPIYYGSHNPYASDHAVIAMIPGLNPEQRILVLAGTNTYGVQAAAEFVCRPDLVRNLLSRLSLKPDRPLPNFEALISVKVNGGVPVHSQLVTVRLR